MRGFYSEGLTVRKEICVLKWARFILGGKFVSQNRLG